jgi:bifunctional ADP-heptose synthase (sugar kinase/adenylyltransferase)
MHGIDPRSWHEIVVLVTHGNLDINRRTKAVALLRARKCHTLVRPKGKDELYQDRTTVIEQNSTKVESAAVFC